MSENIDYELSVGTKLEIIVNQAAQTVFLADDLIVEIECIGGGGGGGGSTRGGTGGSGGRAGQYIYRPPTVLKAGTYTVEVGVGGRGGMVKKSYDDGEIDHAHSGQRSRIYKMGGSEIVSARGGEAGTPNQSGRADGDAGQALVNSEGVLIANGGSAGPRDYAGGNGAFPGAGGGGGGVFVAGGSSRTGSGANGRIIMHALKKPT